MTIYTTPTVPTQETFGIVTATVSCLKKKGLLASFKYDQETIDKLNDKLLEAAVNQGGNAVFGVTYQLMMPTIDGYVEFKLVAIGTAIKA